MRQAEGREVVIVEAVRTPIGRGHKEKGYYKDTHPNALLGKVYTEVIERSGIDAAEVEDVIAGCVQQFGEQGFNIARNAWLQEGLPIETPGTTVDRQCGSAQQAVNFSAALIAAGVHDAMIGGGVEHMGHFPFAAGMKTQGDFGFAFAPEMMAKLTEGSAKMRVNDALDDDEVADGYVLTCQAVPTSDVVLDG